MNNKSYKFDGSQTSTYSQYESMAVSDFMFKVGMFLMVSAAVAIVVFFATL